MTALNESQAIAASTSTASAARPIHITRLVRTELRKMFNTRSGFWLLVSIGVLSVVAIAAVLVFAESAITYRKAVTAIGLPMSVVLPMIAILAVTSEWSQRSGLTTFTLVPRRGRVIRAKACATLLVGVGSMVIALAVGALGNVAGSALAGLDPVWDVSLPAACQIVLSNLVGMAVGFTLGVVLRNSAGAIVAYFVVSLIMPEVFALLAHVRPRFEDLRPWVDYSDAQATLFIGATNTPTEWAMLASSTLIWVAAPLIVGLQFLRRSEIK